MTEDNPIHASCVAISGRAVLLMGPSGSGKSDLALRLIDRGAALVSDDYTALTLSNGLLLASPPDTIAGMIEVRHIGIVHLPCVSNVPVALVIGLEDRPERMPDCPATIDLLGVAVPRIALAGLEPSAPIKLEHALARFGLGGSAA
ncbi:MAG: HPr kinase/phosphatase C-terminal domain-containing protein [Sphingobium sp.]|nr:HPr kinase/phosphatase C-terminal domain-containing protein [Sphingobium sp.]